MGWTVSATNRVLSTAGYQLRRLPAGARSASPPAPAGPPPTKPALTRPVKHLRTQSEPGSRRARNFFDDYPRFFESSQTSPIRGRLNLRYEAIIGENHSILEGARVLDIASHDGRWSFAALKAGAAHVTGVEGRASLVEEAHRNFALYGVDQDQFTFSSGDLFDVLSRETPKVDVVMCLGFFYHTLRYNELLKLIRDANPRYLIIDTAVVQTDKPFILVRTEDSGRERNAIQDAHSFTERVLIGRPSIPALRRMVEAYGFHLDSLADWGGLLRDNPDADGVGVYRKGNRVTARCSSTV
jgi:hypothetical protein